MPTLRIKWRKIKSLSEKEFVEYLSKKLIENCFDLKKHITIYGDKDTEEDVYSQEAQTKRIQCAHCCGCAEVKMGVYIPDGWLKDDLGLFCCQQCKDDEHSFYDEEE